MLQVELAKISELIGQRQRHASLANNGRTAQKVHLVSQMVVKWPSEYIWNHLVWYTFGVLGPVLAIL